MWLYFHTINHAMQVFFKVSFLGFVDATVMCIIKYCHSHDQRASLECTLQNKNAQDLTIKYHTEGSACRIENVRLDT